MITMAQEYASIQYMFFSDSKKENRQRSKNAKYRIAKGYVKYAKYSANPLKAVGALLTSLAYNPGLVVTKGYIIAWLSALRLLPLARKVKQLFLFQSRNIYQ